MKKLIILGLFCLGTFSTQADSKIRRYQNKVTQACKSSNLNKLLLKKSLIELVKGQECEGKFTNLVISKCDSLNCNEINKIYKEVEQVRSGSVVGEE